MASPDKPVSLKSFAPHETTSYLQSDITLEMEKLCVTQIRSSLEERQIFPSHLEFHKSREINRDAVVRQFQAFFASEKLCEETHTVSVKHPATWWDAFKIRFFPKALLGRFPAQWETKSETVKFTQRAIYPEFAKHFAHKGGRPFKVTINKEVAE